MTTKEEFIEKEFLASIQDVGRLIQLDMTNALLAIGRLIYDMKRK